MNKTIIIIPVYNENLRAVKTTREILKNTHNPVLVIDDGSSDNTLELLNKNFANNTRVQIYSHIINLGKGSAMKTACELAIKLGAKNIIFIDGDGQHDPKYLSQFEKGFKSHSLIFGYRRLNDRMPLPRRLGNIIAKKLVQIIFKIKRKDLLCGYFGFATKLYPQIKWTSQRYGVETEIATKVAKRKIDFCEIMINTKYVDKYKGVNLIDGLKILINIPFWYFK